MRAFENQEQATRGSPASNLEILPEKELVVLRLPDDETRRNKIYSAIYELLGKAPWAQGEDDTATEALNPPRALGISSGSKSSVRTSPSKGKQKDLSALGYHSYDDLIQLDEPPSVLSLHGTSSATVSLATTESDDLLGLLAVAQHRNIAFLPFQCAGDRSNLIGIGGTAKITKGASISTTRGDNIGLVFKRTKSEIDNEKADVIFRSVLSEIYILGHPVERIKLCWEIGNALRLMHTYKAIHGDIEPQNVLICKGSDGSYSAQVTDFGYSTILAQESNEAEIILPESWPWTAPEIVRGEPITFKRGIAADVFSYGLLCFWVLCYNNLEQDPRYTIEKHKRSPHFAVEAFRMVASVLGKASSDLRQHWNLEKLFNDTLAEVSEKGVLDVDTLPGFFGISERPLPVSEHYGKSSLLKSQAEFKLPNLLSSISRCPRVVVEEFFRRLEDRLEAWPDDEWDDTARGLAEGLALCYELGLGTAKNPQMTEIWLSAAGISHHELNPTIKMVESDTNNPYPGCEILSKSSENHQILNRERQSIKFCIPWLHRALRQTDDEYLDYDVKVADLDRIYDEENKELIMTITKEKEEESFFMSWIQVNFYTHDGRNVNPPHPSSHLVIFSTSVTSTMDQTAFSQKEFQGIIRHEVIKADRADGNRGSGDDDGIDAALDEAIEFVEQGILEVDKDEDVLLLAAFANAPELT
ncbi:hypothetical protein TWF102_002764 [Orbilia oligospora]|uniref:Protein kinase domain-containing protein n=1 Tax=Orbilia oligospora TaxID=2813651 RepID=A0A7C8J9X4_ORBOL|nr:hypothetical protein TWF102_002764 [Orbilia oligospora]